MSIQMQPVYTEESIQHWQLCATLLVEEDGLWKPAGMLTGDFIHGPARKPGPSGPG